MFGLHVALMMRRTNAPCRAKPPQLFEARKRTRPSVCISRVESSEKLTVAIRSVYEVCEPLLSLWP